MLLEVKPVVHRGIQDLCRRPYPGHPKGCPNYGHKLGCPPLAPLFSEVFDLSKDVFAIIIEFDLEQHTARMRLKHPSWSESQCRCLLYWQPKVRKLLKGEVARFLPSHPGYVAEMTPEAMGVDVTRTLRNAGVILEWPPRRIVRQVALAGVPLSQTRPDGPCDSAGQLP